MSTSLLIWGPCRRRLPYLFLRSLPIFRWLLNRLLYLGQTATALCDRKEIWFYKDEDLVQLHVQWTSQTNWYIDGIQHEAYLRALRKTRNVAFEVSTALNIAVKANVENDDEGKWMLMGMLSLNPRENPYGTRHLMGQML